MHEYAEFWERRDNPRQRLGRLATIKLGVGIEPRYVLVSNVSTEGVRLQLNGIEPVDEFVLLFHGNGAARQHLQSCLAAGSRHRRQV